MISCTSQARWVHSTCHQRSGIVFIDTIIWNVYLEHTVYWHLQHRSFVRPANISRFASSIKLIISQDIVITSFWCSHLIWLKTCPWILSASQLSARVSLLNTRWRYLHLAFLLLRETTYRMGYLIHKGGKARPFLYMISSTLKLLWQTSKFQI